MNSQYVELTDYNNEMPPVFNPNWTRQEKAQYFQERFMERLINELNGFSNFLKCLTKASGTKERSATCMNNILWISFGPVPTLF